MSIIPYGRQDITPEDIAAVIEVLQSDWLTQGPKIPEFEAALASYCGARYAIVVSSATAALHLACIAAGLKGGDRLWTSPITFVASANCGLYCGATVDFVDIDPHTYNLSVSALAAKLELAQTQGTLPKIVIPVHLAGQSCEMAALAELAQTYGFTLIEDASHAIGGQYRGRPIGCCEFSTMAVFSFHPVKIITTGEGGAILTNDPDLYQKLIRLRSHGITRDPQQMVSDSHGPWYYQQLELGFNYRMTDLQAALGLRQLQRLDLFVERRRFLAQRYHQYLADLPLTLPFQHPDTRSSWHLYIIRLKRDQIQTSHREVFEALRALGIGVNLHYIPVHTQPYYQQLGFQWGDFPNAEAYYQEAISLPLYYGLTLAQQDQVIQALKQVLA
ncbi:MULTISPECIES: UDP-4-amino-4,6-dideoxy-N-acetyl-beta-L-altrosamine transaminase [unclassified Thermosynechococcus]|uniref:UDP-4-amino-4, 6-dideoxy-N-acetyl-beta-L-altrosamine transaminase n=1 Tax=unclassified Thermosynechococcus TaxID=2622553 RepID=UPI001A0CC451|nr:MULTISPECIES: UDP-4-amino-4,6-dideoxy-N-acetyl-beta-L-altrosamine transaminase [unclassified Thermosynechococcus]HIK35522.1 UDP-4-amino-4,6-dideoxy-N-acetyl-beta-L-altrosamine transaminase [Thermosynechococcus sp. M98_K2018_005]HIK48914.1 UDP-4-amino-4,6-dideoxy-N-acetyl-beta-L-altrosamine transaminase [Thermosynechococcus sp. M55_K2018_012]